jgi:hypothetical protein
MSDENESRLQILRADRPTRWGSTLAAVVVGLLLASIHWLGLVVGAAAVAVPQQTLPRGLAVGLGFGAVAVAANVAVLATTGPAALDTALAMRQVFGVSVALSLVAGLVGGLVRGVV